MPGLEPETICPDRVAKRQFAAEEPAEAIKRPGPTEPEADGRRRGTSVQIGGGVDIFGREDEDVLIFFVY